MAATLVVLAAGMGSRFGGPKQLVPVGPLGQSILHYNVRDGAEAGFEQIVVVTRSELEAQVREVVGRAATGAEAVVALQSVPHGRSKPLGTAEAVLAAAGELDGAFGVANADDLYGPDSFVALRAHLAEDPDRAAIVGFRLADTVPLTGSVSRALLAVAGGSVQRIVEVHGIHRTSGGWSPRAVEGFGDLTDSSMVSMNLVGLPGWTVGMLQKAVSDFVAGGARGEIYLPEVVGSLLDAGRLEVRLLATNDEWAGMTNPEDLELVRAHVRRRRMP